MFNKISDVPCTACRYCVEGCPQNTPISEIFKIRNNQLSTGKIEESTAEYLSTTEEGARASDCIACGQCESVCTQKIDIINQLKRCAEVFE